MITKEEFRTEVLNNAERMRKDYPELRKGQAVFNVVDASFYHIARISQFDYGIDCFYNDTMIEPFLDKCYELFNEMYNHE